MILKVVGSQLLISQNEFMTTDSVNAYIVKLIYDSKWSSMLSRVMIIYQPSFRDNPISLDITNTDEITLPTLYDNDYLYIGLYGVNSTDRIVTQYVTSIVNQGCFVTGVAPPDPPNSLYDYIVQKSDEALSVAQSVRDDADAGKFNGLTPYIGTNGHWWIGDTDTGYSASGNGCKSDAVSFNSEDFVDVSSTLFKLVIPATAHSLGMSAIMSKVERSDMNYSNVDVQSEKISNGDIIIYSNIKFPGRVILLEV